MALIQCPDCGKPVSSSATACPACGYPVAKKLAVSPTEAIPAAAAKQDPGTLLLEVRPSWWGYFWYLFFFFLIIPPFIAWLKRASTVLRIYPNRLALERGIFSKCYQDYNPHDIRSIDVDQSLWGRMLGISDLTISTSATVEASEQLRAIPDPRGVRDLILAQRGES